MGSRRTFNTLDRRVALRPDKRLYAGKRNWSRHSHSRHYCGVVHQGPPNTAKFKIIKSKMKAADLLENFTKSDELLLLLISNRKRVPAIYRDNSTR